MLPEYLSTIPVDKSVKKLAGRQAESAKSHFDQNLTIDEISSKYINLDCLAGYGGVPIACHKSVM